MNGGRSMDLTKIMMSGMHPVCPRKCDARRRPGTLDLRDAVTWWRIELGMAVQGSAPYFVDTATVDRVSCRKIRFWTCRAVSPNRKAGCVYNAPEWHICPLPTRVPSGCCKRRLASGCGYFVDLMPGNVIKPLLALVGPLLARTRQI